MSLKFARMPSLQDKIEAVEEVEQTVEKQIEKDEKVADKIKKIKQ